MNVCAHPVLSISGEDIAELLRSAPALVAIFDANDRLVFANDAFREAYFADPAMRPYWHEFMRENYLHRRGPLIQTDDIEAWLTAADARRGTVPYRAFEAEMCDGRMFWITETLAKGGLLLLLASEITAVKAPGRSVREERDEARRASWTDELTDVANRRYVMNSMNEWLARQRQEEAFGEHSLALIDIDHFKTVNDRYGHEFGDTVLIQFCRSFVSRIRLHDLFGRIGGEEFLLFLPNCSLADATTRLRTILADIQSLCFAEAPDFTCSFSAGVSEVLPHRTLDELIKDADMKLYRAKARGRSAIVARDNL